MAGPMSSSATLPLAILNSSPETNVDGDEVYGCGPALYDLKHRSWATFFREPYSNLLLAAAPDDGNPSSSAHSSRGHVMRMPGVEMGEYGVLPETDPFMVVVCEVCQAAVKPQGLRKHIHRHNADPSSLAQLITPCSVSVSALKFDPKAENSNSSSSSVVASVLGAGGVGEASSSSSSTTTDNNNTFKDFTALESVLEQTTSNTTANSNPLPAKNSSSSSSSKSSSGGSLKMKLSKSGLKSLNSSSNSSSSSTSSHSSSRNHTTTEEQRGQFLPGDSSSSSIKSSLRPHTSNNNNSEEVSNTTPLVPLPVTTSTKKLSLKEREYDPNKHCGVILVDTGKHCTRTLTCKSHALSLRRNVLGRSMSFDQLLSDHRAMRALLASGKVPPPSAVLPPPAPLPQTPMQVVVEEVKPVSKKRELSDPHSHSNNNQRRASASPEQPPAKKQQLERSSRDSSHHSHSRRNHHHQSSSSTRNTSSVVKVEEPEPPAQLLMEEPPFRESLATDFALKPFHENGFELHGGGQLVAAENGGAYFLKSENSPPPPVTTTSQDNDCQSGQQHLKATPAVASIITVPLTMLANVMYVNGRNCILEADSVATEEENENRPGEKGRHVEVVDRSGEKRRYLTLSSGRQQRATNRLRLNVIRTEDVSEQQKNGTEQESSNAAQDFPGIDTWFHQIPKPTYVNCFKLSKLGTSSAVLSRRYLNIRKSLIMNMGASQGLSAGGGANGGQGLNRSNSQTVNSPGSVGGGGGGAVEKVNNSSFNVERIKV